MPPSIAVCIPAYNRASFLPPLLDSILNQSMPPSEIVICEDNSSERAAIRTVVDDYKAKGVGSLRYFENETTLGYDGNLRKTVACATADYCFFMGNDDLVAVEAMRHIAEATARYPEIGVVLRSYASFEKDPSQLTQHFRYFSEEKFFTAGAETIITFFRRSIVISGMCVHRTQALSAATDQFDGTLLYQLFLVGKILSCSNGVYLPEPAAYYRTGGVPDFGNSAAEKSRFVPKAQTPASSVAFMRGMIEIAQAIENETRLKVFKPIFKDMANYSYPVLAIQARQPRAVFLRYARDIACLGFWRYPMFYVYFCALLVCGPANVDRLIGIIKKKLGYTPRIGRMHEGTPIP